LRKEVELSVAGLEDISYSVLTEKPHLMSVVLIPRWLNPTTVAICAPVFTYFDDQSSGEFPYLIRTLYSVHQQKIGSD